MGHSLRAIFVGPNGVRAGWRFLAYVALLIGLLQGLQALVEPPVDNALRLHGSTLNRTGSLWLAAGFHFSFDFMQFFVIGTRNGGVEPVGRLLNVTFPGPVWANGGPLGTEASYFMLPAIVLMFAYILLRHPKATPLQR